MALILANEVALVATMPPDAVIFDVGANVGDWTQMALDVLDRPRIHAFEPSPAANRFAIRHPDVKLDRCALGAEPGTMPFFSPDARGSELGSLHRRAPLGPVVWHYAHDVPVETLDRVCEREQVEVINLLKVDVENGELDVLRGARMMLRWGVIEHIFWEHLPDGPSFYDFWDLLSGRLQRYRVWELTADAAAPIERYDKSLEPGDGRVRFFGATRRDLPLPPLDEETIAGYAPVSVHTPV